MEFSYRVSVIVPVYNVEKYIADTLDSILAQTIDLSEIEVLLINDGSPDGSESICREYLKKNPCFKLFCKENEGLSKTRNFGINHAKGKYLLYLDSDDTLTPETIKNVADFFDAHYDEIDMVTYPIVPIVNGQPSAMHYRYRTLKKSRVYDLNRPENAYITQTNINICVKNEPKNNVLFDTTPGFRHEDQKYCTQVLQKKMKIGFCKEASYEYIHHANSIVRTYFYAYYIFDSTMNFWEELFADYPDKVPPYIQGLYLNDINWKMASDILFPYQFKGEEFDRQMDRIWALLRRVDDNTILLHPFVDKFHKYYFLEKKDDGEITPFAGASDIALLKENRLVYTAKSIEIVITKFKVTDSKIKMIGFVKSPVFSFSEKPRLYIFADGNRAAKSEIPLKLSSWSYYKTKVKTNTFWMFTAETDIAPDTTVEFCVESVNGIHATSFLFMPNTVFNLSVGRNMYFKNGMVFKANHCSIYMDTENVKEKKKYKRLLSAYYYGRDKNVAIMRAMARVHIKKYDRLWLYYDCKGVYKDNAYYQFVHDFYKNDGVERYYVVNDDLDRSELFDHKQKRHIVRFGSFKHKMLFFRAEKIITAFVEKVNYCPFLNDVIPHYGDLMSADVIYLQHGVLHAHTPWKYSLDRLNIDKEVISSEYERNNLIENYNFMPDYLIDCGMPRYDHIDVTLAPRKRILYAPSWRKYLISQLNDGRWIQTDSKFMASAFFKQSSEFLNSPRLREMLEKYGYELDFKLHPIFSCYRDLYSIENEHVHIIGDKSVNEFEYSAFITDFSSFLFDFVYLERPLIYFVPDYDMFSSGMNDYRQLDIPFEDGFGPYVESSDAAADELEKILACGCKIDEKYEQKVKGFFISRGKDHEDNLYKALIEE